MDQLMFLILSFLIVIKANPDQNSQSSLSPKEIIKLDRKQPFSVAEVDFISAEMWKKHQINAKSSNILKSGMYTEEKEGWKMKYMLKAIGKKPQQGYPLYIALHGGGGAPSYVNDQQWNHMKTYFQEKKREAQSWL